MNWLSGDRRVSELDNSVTGGKLMLKNTLIACFVIATLTVTAVAADITEKWSGQMPSAAKQ
jgi:hypothetical protein